MTENQRKECAGPSSDYDLEKQLKAMDRFLDLHESNILRMEAPVTVLNPERNFLDEFIDIQCTPAGQNFPFQYTGAWDGFFEAWKLVGSLLSNAMSSFEHKTIGMANEKNVIDPEDTNEEKIVNQDAV